MHSQRLTLAALAFGSMLCAQSAQAFTIQTSITSGCHEGVTEDILRNIRKSQPELGVPLATTQDDRALMEDVAFSVPGDLHDIAAVTLILGVRDNDVKNFGAEALDQLAALNADPTAQKLHCLRSAAEDEPNGSAAAIDDCRAFSRPARRHQA